MLETEKCDWCWTHRIYLSTKLDLDRNDVVLLIIIIIIIMIMIIIIITRFQSED